MTSIGKKIRQLRKAKKLTQEQLAVALNVSGQAVSKWETEQTVPDISLLPVIARFFGVSMDELFGYRPDALSYTERFLRFMADNGALRFGSFLLRSGRLSPYDIFTDAYHSGSQIAKLGEFYAETIWEQNVEPGLLWATEEFETPMVIATSMALYRRFGTDFDYRLGEGVKGFGGQRVVLIKDTMTSGSSLDKALQAVRRRGGEVHDVIVAVDRQERGKEGTLSARQTLEQRHNVHIHAIASCEDIQRALERGVLAGREHLPALREYLSVYGGEDHGR